MSRDLKRRSNDILQVKINLKLLLVMVIFYSEFLANLHALTPTLLDAQVNEF